jgi:hypothetical protein
MSKYFKLVANAVAILFVATLAVGQYSFPYFLNSSLYEDVIYYSDDVSTNVASPRPGQVTMQINAAASPNLEYYDGYNDATYDVMNLQEAQTVSGSKTFTGDIQLDAELTTSLYRDEFSRPCLVREEDYTAEVGTDAGMMIVQCLGGIAPQYHFRIDGAQATPWVQEATAGAATGGPYMLDLDNDAANTEGVDIVFADDPQVAARGGFVYGQTVRFRIGVYVADISDTSLLHTGLRLNSDYVDDAVLATQNSYVAFSSPAGTTSATSAINGTDKTELEATCDISDTTEIIFEISLSATGVPTFRCGATEAALAALTTPTAGIASFEAGDVFVPYFAALNGASAGGEYHITFVEIEYTDE